MKNLYREFKHFEGQPVKVLTDDGRAYVGIDLCAMEDAVRIIDDCGRLIYIEYCHIDAVIEPQMKLRRCCYSTDVECPSVCEDAGVDGKNGNWD